eukprot:CAMPEP_0201595928 /NCGR_PEP_ID=MMETSP0190_2-20130828/192767_1 /ASSEMBLY_ACC=CAM_ASM_000263 /TAXON_ID=37353 /ORGANISM="Rosalina sp." /LENGTH=355 /DNA_ID=CAMNT_0048056079 /DNA_START=441 /DNA_END=1505 /DNA_ORIENTATION=+
MIEVNIMRIASLSKSFAAVAMLTLIDNNDMGITLNSTIYDVIKDDDEILATFNAFTTLRDEIDKIRISDLLSMKSGLRHYEEAFEYYWHYSGNESNTILYEKLALFGDDPLFREIRSGYKYSSFGYGIIGVLIEVISGQTFYEYIEDVILDPMGLENIGDAESIDRSRYTKQNVMECATTDRGYKLLVDCDLNDTYSSEYYDQVVWYKNTAGGLIASTLDIAKYADNIVWNRAGVLSDEMHSEMFRGQTYVKTVTAGDDWYGFGWHMYGETDPNFIWHTGGAIGGVARLTITKDIELVVCAICDTQSGQSGITAIVETLEQYFRDNDGEPWTDTSCDTTNSTNGDMGNDAQGLYW